LKAVIDKLKSSGAALSLGGSTLTISKINGWKLFRLAWDNRDAICAVGLVTTMMRQKMEPLDLQRNCTFCTKYRQYTCEFHCASIYGIPAAVLAKGCDKFSPNMGLYF
jgi:hypothetical protein